MKLHNEASFFFTKDNHFAFCIDTSGQVIKLYYFSTKSIKDNGFQLMYYYFHQFQLSTFIKLLIVFSILLSAVLMEWPIAMLGQRSGKRENFYENSTNTNKWIRSLSVRLELYFFKWVVDKSGMHWWESDYYSTNFVAFKVFPPSPPPVSLLPLPIALSRWKRQSKWQKLTPEPTARGKRTKLSACQCDAHRIAIIVQLKQLFRSAKEQV